MPDISISQTTSDSENTNYHHILISQDFYYIVTSTKLLRILKVCCDLYLELLNSEDKPAVEDAFIFYYVQDIFFTQKEESIRAVIGGSYGLD